ncbi:MAG: F0F1 ATP synthase subunit delta [Bacteroidales bacterium]|nr:F0F1 ATP synthase subunit delta [Bacteroidales bacterium]
MSIAKRYAQALCLYATENGLEDAVYAEAVRLADTFAQVHDLQKAMANPQLTAETKLQLIVGALDRPPTPILLRFIDLVLQHRRESSLKLIMWVYIDVYRKQKGINVGSITTAAPMSDEIIQRIRRWVEQQQGGIVMFTNKVNPDIEGGFIFELNSRRLDASVRSQMQRVKKQFIDKNKRIV